MSAAQTPQEIARGLTPARRAALLWLPADGSPRDWYDLAADRYAHRRLRTAGLEDAKINRATSLMQRWATPLGQAVRAALEAEVAK